MAGGVVSFIESEGVRVYHGDCIEIMRTLPDASVDSVVTDPPYLIDFMGKGWDASDGIAGKPEVWREALRVLKPGGHLLAFGGTRTWHRLAVAIEDAGFEIRDNVAYLHDGGLPGPICWVYGSGFPKSLDVSKAIDKALSIGLCTCVTPKPMVKLEHEKGVQRRDTQTPRDHDGQSSSRDGRRAGEPSQAVEASGQCSDLPIDSSCAQSDELRNVQQGDGQKGPSVRQVGKPLLFTQLFQQVPEKEGHGNAALRQGMEGNTREGSQQRQGVSELLQDRGQGLGSSPSSAVPVRGQEHNGQPHIPLQELPSQGGSKEQQTTFTHKDHSQDRKRLRDNGHLCAQCGNLRRDLGGTALKPAFEPIVVARKPLIGTVAENVLAHGTGALNIDGCRIGTEILPAQSRGVSRIGTFEGADGNITNERTGRWPANVILDESQAAELDKQSGVTTSKVGVHPDTGRSGGIMGAKVVRGKAGQPMGHNDTGGASRFFYCAKAPKKERPNVDGIAHPTVKPLKLMEYLCRLVTPPGGTILEPFAGSGTTIEAALNEGFNVIGIEMTDEYLPLIMARIERHGEKLC